MTETLRVTSRITVCVGRLQPPQHRHLELLNTALAAADCVMLILGGAAQSLDTLNPWSTAERLHMLRVAGVDSRVIALPLADCWYDDARWAAAVRGLVAAECLARGLNLATAHCSLLGLERAEAAYYAPLFPDWTVLPAPTAPRFECELSERLLEASPDAVTDLLEAYVPAALHAFIREGLDLAAGEELRAEQGYIANYRRAWQSAPFPPVFVTVDTLALWREQILLVERGRRPGLGLLALPGGFLDPGESLLAAARRELAEETGLDLNAALQPTAVRVFDHPLRSRRGRTITHVFAFDLSAWPAPPQVAGGDDARDARWFSLATLKPERFFEDHYAILQVMRGLD
jgi:bifunctional NMN adenylyltransferase/nudix hydrolase